jgi:hypothetical protein
MTNSKDVLEAVKATLASHGFSIEQDLRLNETSFDLVAEDDTRLLFIVSRSSNQRWIEDFREHQASLAETLSKVHLGKKWRDVYLIEITCDPLDTDTELQISEAIESNTLVARKLIVDASSVDLSDSEAFARLLGVILPLRHVESSSRSINLLGLLHDYLIKSGFSNTLVSRMINTFSSDGGSLAQLVLEDVP